VSGTRVVALLRGINLGSRNRVAMADLRKLFADLGYPDAVTHLQSGNVVFTSRAARPNARAIEKRLKDDLGHEIAVVLRTRDELAAVVEGNPLPESTTDGARFMVSFLADKPDPARVKEIDPDLSAPDRFRVVGREVYMWLPNGLHKSKLSNALWERSFKTVATMRNWNTVTKLLELADS
jgi:uncharacterized protein (DUF1697 family)